MSRVCKLVGNITDATMEEALTKGDPSLGDSLEKFYTLNFEGYGFSIPLMISEHYADKMQCGRVEVTGALMSVYKRKQLPKYYFYVNDIEPVEPDVQFTNTVSFVGTITKRRPLTHDDAGRDVFTVTLSDQSPHGETSILSVVFRGPMARKWNFLQKGTKICGEGYLKAYRSTYEIYAQDLKIL